MANSLEIFGRIRVGKNWVVRVCLVWSVDNLGKGNGDHMVQESPTLCDDQIVETVFLVDMGPFRCRASGSIPDVDYLAHSASVEIDRGLEYPRSYLYQGCPCHVDLAIIVPEEAAVVPICLKMKRIRPAG